MALDVLTAPTAVSAPAPRRIRLRAAGWATAVAGLTLLIGVASPPFAAAVIALLLALVAPTSADLGRRLVTNLTLMSLGLVLLRWIPWEGARTWGGLAAAAGILTWVLRTRGHRSLVPRPTATHLVPLLAGMAALAVAWPLLGRTPTSAMALLMGGWDHAGHFSMYLAQREGLEHAVPPGEIFQFANYPQLFHAWMAGLAELLWGASGGVAVELVRYAALQAVVYVGLVVVGVTAAVDACTTQRWRVQAAVGALVSSLMLGFPGSALLAQGYLSVLWSIAGAVLVINLARCGGAPGAVRLVVAACGVVAVSAWPLLLPIVGYAWLSLLLSAWRAGRRPRWFALAMAIGTGMSALWLVWVSGRADPGGHVVTPGGIQHTSAILSFGVPALILIGGHMALRRGGHRPRWSPVVWSAAGCLLLVCGLAAVQWSLAGELSYYFWKTALCGQTVLLIVVAPDVARTLDRFAHRTMTSGGAVRTLMVISTVSVACLGLGADSGRSSVAQPFLTRWSMGSWASQQELAGEVVANSALPVPLAKTIWVKETDAYAPALADQWLHSYTRARALPLERQYFTLNEARYHGPDGLTEASLKILQASDLMLLIDDPEVFTKVSAELPPHERGRVVLRP